MSTVSPPLNEATRFQKKIVPDVPLPADPDAREQIPELDFLAFTKATANDLDVFTTPPSFSMTTQVIYFDPLSLIGVVLLVVLFNAFLFGVVSQQLYEYSLSGFTGKDSMRMRIFVGALYTVVSFQSIVLWQLAWSYFVVDYSVAKGVRGRTWQVPVSSACQCILVLSTNIFFAVHIYARTRNRLKSGVIIAVSIVSFGFGMAIAMLYWFGRLTPDGTLTRPQTVIVAFWHVLQAIAGCLVTYSLMRILLNSRTSIQKSDGVVNYLIPRAIQMAPFAMIWAISSLVAFIFMPKICSLFDLTAGPIYTHAIFDTLQSRHRFRERAVEPNQIDMSFIAQSPSRTLDRKRASVTPRAAHSKVSTSMANSGPGLETTHQSTSRVSTDKDDRISEIECARVGQPGIHYEFSYAHYVGEL